AQSLASAKRCGSCHAVLAALYLCTGEFTAAQRHVDHALNYADLAGDELGAARARELHGRLLCEAGAYHDALRELNHALALRKNTGDAPGVGRSLHALGVLWTELDDSSCADDAFESALALAQAHADRSAEIEIGLSWARLLARRGETLEALDG